MAASCIPIRSAWGWFNTDTGGSFDLNGEYFTRSFPAARGPTFPIADLPTHLRGLRIVDNGHAELGDEANTMIDGMSYFTPEDLNRYFGLG